MAGDNGVDQGELEDAVGISPSGMRRTVRLLSAVSYDKTSEGYGVCWSSAWTLQTTESA